MIQPPNHKQVWCAGLPVKMRLLGWPEETCRATLDYVEKVSRIYTGRAWYAYTREVDTFVLYEMPRTAQTLVGYLPRRTGVDRNLNIQA